MVVAVGFTDGYIDFVSVDAVRVQSEANGDEPFRNNGVFFFFFPEETDTHYGSRAAASWPAFFCSGSFIIVITLARA